MNESKQAIETSLSGLVGQERCREILFPNPKDRLSRRTFLGLQADGKVPFYKIGGRVFYRPSEVLAAFEKQFRSEIEPKSEPAI